MNEGLASLSGAPINPQLIDRIVGAAILLLGAGASRLAVRALV